MRGPRGRGGRETTRRLAHNPTAMTDLELALQLADLADSITLPRFGAEDLRVDTKPDMTPVTDADRAVEEALRRRIASARPGDGVLGEEQGDAARGGGRRWILGPAHATPNYVRGCPTRATPIP